MGMGSGGYESRRRGIAKPSLEDATDLDVCPYCGTFFAGTHKCEKLPELVEHHYYESKSKDPLGALLTGPGDEIVSNSIKR